VARSFPFLPFGTHPSLFTLLSFSLFLFWFFEDVISLSFHSRLFPFPGRFLPFFGAGEKSGTSLCSFSGTSFLKNLCFSFFFDSLFSSSEFLHCRGLFSSGLGGLSSFECTFSFFGVFAFQLLEPPAGVSFSYSLPFRELFALPPRFLCFFRSGRSSSRFSPGMEVDFFPPPL